MCYVTKPQVWSGSKPENLPELSTSWPRESFFSFWMNKYICSRPVLIVKKKMDRGVCVCVKIVYYKENLREKKKKIVASLCERKETCAHLTFLIWGFSSAERFHRALPRAAEHRRFPLTLADQGFAFTLFSLLFSGYILFCVLRKVRWDFPLPRENNPCSWANRTPT